MNIRLNAWALCLIFISSLSTPSIYAERSSTVITAPGILIEQKKGWFGSSHQTYRDAFGNTVVKKRNIFGRETSEKSLLGGKIQQKGENLTVEGPNGTALVTKKKSWLHGKETRIDGNAVFDSVKNLLQQPTP